MYPEHLVHHFAIRLWLSRLKCWHHLLKSSDIFPIQKLAAFSFLFDAEALPLSLSLFDAEALGSRSLLVKDMPDIDIVWSGTTGNTSFFQCFHRAKQQHEEPLGM